jgi:hypothetical protein
LGQEYKPAGFHVSLPIKLTEPDHAPNDTPKKPLILKPMAAFHAILSAHI